MKSKILNISLLLASVVILFSCEKDENKVTIKGNITPNALNALSADSFKLSLDNAAVNFQDFGWTSVDYGFDVATTYKIQADSAGNNFANAMDVATVTNLNTASINEGDFNKLLLNRGFEPGTPVKLEFRVATNINPNVPSVYSNLVSGVIIPYATTFPPIFMCGAATGGWDWTKGVEVRSIAPSIYRTIAVFINNEAFRFFKQAGWDGTSYNYPFFTGFVSDSLVNAADGDQNFKVVSPTGYYQVTVNLKTKSVDFDAVAEPVLYMTGDALGGWDWSTNYVKLTWVKNGVFEATTDFANGGSFRFFAQADWNPTSYNYPYFADGSVDPMFVNADDGDKNFKFVGTTGTYKITVNMLDFTVTMETP